jgi:hypothetical protein
MVQGLLEQDSNSQSENSMLLMESVSSIPYSVGPTTNLILSLFNLVHRIILSFSKIHLLISFHVQIGLSLSDYFLPIFCKHSPFPPCVPYVSLSLIVRYLITGNNREMCVNMSILDCASVSKNSVKWRRLSEFSLET